MDVEKIRSKYPPETSRPVLITEVTRMKGGFSCVAGWDLHKETIVRPLQCTGANWRVQEGSSLAPFNLVDLDVAGRGKGGYPHRTEDTLLSKEPGLLETLTEAEAYRLLKDTTFPSIAAVFDNQLIEDKYVIDGTHCRSLGGVLAFARNLEFVEDFGKLRVRIDDSDRKTYRLKVTSEALQTIFDDKGTAAVNEWLSESPQSSPVILRIGLPRGWIGPNKDWNPKRCYVQLNGIIRLTR